MATCIDCPLHVRIYAMKCTLSRRADYDQDCDQVESLFSNISTGIRTAVYSATLVSKCGRFIYYSKGYLSILFLHSTFAFRSELQIHACLYTHQSLTPNTPSLYLRRVGPAALLLA